MIHIKTFETYKYYNKELCPIFWDNFKFNERIREKLITIAMDFFKELELKNVDIKDIRLVGSLANFNWTKYSDLDVHIVVDYTEINKDVELVSSYLKDKKSLNDILHNITIQDFEVEVYVEDINDAPHSLGVYSLLKNGWLKIPVYSQPEIDYDLIDKKVEEFEEQIDKIESLSKGKISPEDSTTYYNFMKLYKKKIMKIRQESLEKDGELSTGNLIYKRLRNDGYLDKVFDLINKLYDNIYIQ
ncbi:hypothetical protein M0Q50_02565 [bacterium]|jgi:predicted nucleotidyltransferase|nr:hypothetical protein [bacterium]